MKKSLLVITVLVAAACMPAMSYAQDNFLGEIRWVPYNFTPRGWATCDGQLLPISQNTALFSLLGTTYGGDGQTTFALPDLRGRTPIHRGNGPGLSTRYLGEQGGAEVATLTEQQIPAHNHALKAHTGVGKVTSPAGAAIARPGVRKTPDGPWSYADLYSFVNAVPAYVMAPGSIGSTGGGQPHENMSPFTTLTCIIALQGIFPARD